MHIRRLSLQNFRCFDSCTAEFDPRLTLLVGPNGSGKSSLLAGVRGSLQPLLLGMGLEAPLPDTELHRRSVADSSGVDWSEAVFPLRLVADCRGQDNLDFTIELTRSADSSWVDKAERTRFVPRVQPWLGALPAEAVPLIAHLGARTLRPVQGRVMPTSNPFDNRKQVYERALNDEVETLSLVQWFQHHELRALQEGAPPAPYAQARRSVLAAMHAIDIRFVVRHNQLMLLHEGEGWRPFDQLSDGQKRIASIFCELALRCATLNSHLAERCIVETPGIVTIDELDLHLHPKWQRSLIGDLVRTFPKLQFIAASHSPFLLQAAFEHGKVLDVSKGEFVEPMDRSLEDIAESVMGIPMPQRSRRFLELKAKAQEFYEMLESQPVDAESKSKLQAELDAAMAPFANDPAAAAWLEQRRAAAGH
jgi:predicted ATP-binding protein involved in virulence